MPVTVIAADSMDEYNKPDLSHVISQNQRAEDLTRQTAGEFAEQFNLRLFPYTWVTDIDAAAHVVKAKDKIWQYDKLVLATGASAFVPPVEGRELMDHPKQPAGVSGKRNGASRCATRDDRRRWADWYRAGDGFLPRG